jgi:EmrB/QacA subfamily drug resistance transporter
METKDKRSSAPGYKWIVLIITMIGAFMASLDSSIVNVSLPSIMSDFGSSTSSIEWIMTGYMLAMAVTMPLTGWIRDRIGYKNLFIASLFVFTSGSLLCGLSWNLPVLVLARVIQALGAGAITPTVMAMMTEVFPGEERGKALGFYGMGVTIAPAIGPVLGGFLTSFLGWRSIFMVNLPIGVICMTIGLSMLSDDVPHNSMNKPFDFWGFSFLTVFLVPLLLGISKGEEQGWSSPFILACGVTAILGFIGFILAESHTEEKLVDLDLFKVPVFTSCIVVTAVRAIILFGGTFLLPLFIQRVIGYDALTCGLIMLPTALTMAVLMPIAGIFSDKSSPRLMVIAGIVVMGISMFMYWNLDITTSITGIIIPTVVRSLGMALLNAPIIVAMMNSIPKQKIGMATSMVSILLQVGGSLGIAIFGTMQLNRATFHLNAVTETVTNLNLWTGGIASQAHNAGLTYANSMAVANGVLIRNVYQAATVMSYQDVFIIAGILILLSIPLAFLLPTKTIAPKGTAVKKPPVKSNVTIEAA